jgi:hypothetical protein
MSRQSKNAKNIARRKMYTAMHLKGEKGPSRTTPLHGKRWTYRSNPEVAKRNAEAAKAAAPQARGGKKILEGAGSAAA